MNKETARPQKRNMHGSVVVIGASAGGVEALRALVAGLPATFPAAVLVVLHISPHAGSLLHEILDKAGTLPVTQAEDGEPLMGGHIYVAVPDRHLMLDGDSIRLTRSPKENHSRPSINVLFRSAAYSFGPRVIGIVLSGMLDDGTAGLWTIKDQKGMAMVQAPEDAMHSSMPLSAIAGILVDAVLPVTEMPKILCKWISEETEFGDEVAMSEHMEIEHRITLEKRAGVNEVLALGSPSIYACPECHGTLVQIQEGTITRFRCHTGHAYSQKTLLADINEQIDVSLWNAIRGVEERIMLLRQMAEQVKEGKDAELLRHQASKTEQRLEVLRDLIVDDDNLGHDAAKSGELEGLPISECAKKQPAL